MDAVVQQRDALFALQRKCDLAGLQAASRSAVARQLAKYTRNSQQGQFSKQGNRLRDYTSFCSDIGVPPFPISDALLVLYAAAASPLEAGEKKRKQFIYSLRGLAKAIEPLWHRNAEYEQLRGWPTTALALATWKALGRFEFRQRESLSCSQSCLAMSQATYATPGTPTRTARLPLRAISGPRPFLTSGRKPRSAWSLLSLSHQPRNALRTVSARSASLAETAESLPRHQPT